MNRAMVQRIGDAPLEPLAEGGYALRVLRTTGRLTGTERAVPLAVVAHDHRRWLVAPSPARDWVANLISDATCSLDGEDGQLVAVRRADATAALVAQEYARAATDPARWSFPFSVDAELDEVIAVLPRMAVFELMPEEEAA